MRLSYLPVSMSQISISLFYFVSLDKYSLWFHSLRRQGKWTSNGHAVEKAGVSLVRSVWSHSGLAVGVNRRARRHRTPKRLSIIGRSELPVGVILALLVHVYFSSTNCPASCPVHPGIHSSPQRPRMAEIVISNSPNEHTVAYWKAKSAGVQLFCVTVTLS